MITTPRFPLVFLAAVILGLSTTGIRAQSAGLDEAVGADGVTQSLQLTAVQRSAILSSVARRHLDGSTRGIVPIVGAPVPPSAALRDLPDQAALGTAGDGLLKYAMVADEIVVVDPIRMRVVDVIHRRARP